MERGRLGSSLRVLIDASSSARSSVVRRCVGRPARVRLRALGAPVSGGSSPARVSHRDERDRGFQRTNEAPRPTAFHGARSSRANCHSVSPLRESSLLRVVYRTGAITGQRDRSMRISATLRPRVYESSAASILYLKKSEFLQEIERAESGFSAPPQITLPFFDLPVKSLRFDPAETPIADRTKSRKTSVGEAGWTGTPNRRAKPDELTVANRREFSIPAGARLLAAFVRF